MTTQARYYDISLNLSVETVRWATSPPFEFVERRRMSRGDSNNSSALSMSVHAGTHVDAPFHFVPDGGAIDSLPLEIFCGPALVHAVETPVDGVRVIEVPEIKRCDTPPYSPTPQTTPSASS